MEIIYDSGGASANSSSKDILLPFTERGNVIICTTTIENSRIDFANNSTKPLVLVFSISPKKEKEEEKLSTTTTIWSSQCCSDIQSCRSTSTFTQKWSGIMSLVVEEETVDADANHGGTIDNWL
jgi:hypothetical protein